MAFLSSLLSFFLCEPNVICFYLFLSQPQEMLLLPILLCQGRLLTVILCSDMISGIGRYQRIFGFDKLFGLCVCACTLCYEFHSRSLDFQVPFGYRYLCSGNRTITSNTHCIYCSNHIMISCCDWKLYKSFIFVLFKTTGYNGKSLSGWQVNYPVFLVLKWSISFICLQSLNKVWSTEVLLVHA